MFCMLDSRGFRHFRDISANPVINLLACGCLSCLHNFRRFRDSRRFVKSTELQNIGLAKPRFRNTRLEVRELSARERHGAAS